jgi:hypothetical protein
LSRRNYQKTTQKYVLSEAKGHNRAYFRRAGTPGGKPVSSPAPVSQPATSKEYTPGTIEKVATAISLYYSLRHEKPAEKER